MEINCSVGRYQLDMICDSVQFLNKADFKSKRQYLENKIAACAIYNVLTARGIKCDKPLLFTATHRHTMNHYLETADKKFRFEIRSTGWKSGFMIISSDTWHISNGELTSIHNDKVDAFIAINVENEKIKSYLKNNESTPMVIPQCRIMGLLSDDTFKWYLRNNIKPNYVNDFIPDTQTQLETDSYLFPYSKEGVAYYKGRITTSDSLSDASSSFKDLFHVDFDK